MREPGQVLLLSCYELGHPPYALASAAGFLFRAGFRPRLLDLSVEALSEASLAGARLVCISTPMHTALRLGVLAAEEVRRQAPQAKIVFFGLYASLNEEFLLQGHADAIIGGESEEALCALCEALESRALDGVRGVSTRATPQPPVIQRLSFGAPWRSPPPDLSRYARLAKDGEELLAGYTEASRGCLHLCEHCPIPPVYHGRFFVVPEDVVLGDISAQVAAGARHITFGDPDFLNGPGHARKVALALHAAHPGVSFDVTVKVEHLLRHRQLLPELRELGCAFVVSAVESLSDRVLSSLRKGHTRAEVFSLLDVMQEADLPLRPTLVPFTPFSTLNDILELFSFALSYGLIDHIDPLQYAIRLLVPPNSYLLQNPAMTPHLRGFSPKNFSWRWEHPDPRMDALCARMTARVEEAVRAKEAPRETFFALREMTYAVAEREPPAYRLPPERPVPPRLTEPWFC